MFNPNNQKTISKTLSAFTLVELIVVIVILAILATIAFLSFNSYSSSARDSNRLSDMTNIVKGLGVIHTTSGVYPIPDNSITITAGTGYSMYQGTVGNTTLGIIKMSQAKDSLDNTYYSYSINQARTQFSIGGWLENKPSSFMVPSNLNQANAIDYSKRYLIIKGGIVGILTESGTNSPIEQTTTAGTTIDLLTSSKNLILSTSSTVYSNGNNAIYGSGLIVGIIQSNQNGGYLYTTPTNCPDGFIPVPGNLEFNQPGFCVAKYEMKQPTGDAGSWNGTVGAQGPTGTAVSPYCTYSIPCINTGGIAVITTKGVITSKPDGYPIVWLNQYNAIEACKSMGVGYHLITNNEWMTIARDIEKQSSNWSGGTIGTTLNRGQSNGVRQSGTGALPASYGEYGSPNNGFINRRTHNLSNGQIIWDIAGNVFELVNKANTLDGSNYNIGTNGINFSSPKVDICNATDGFYEWSICLNKTISMNGSNNSSYTTANGVGGVRDYDNNIFIRGGRWYDATSAGVFALALNLGTAASNPNVGFRCAK